MFSRLNAALRGVSASILFIAGMAVHAQDAAAPKQALEHVLGTVTALSAADHTVTVKEDKTGVEYSLQLATTKTLLKVDPGAKDLKSATRITADDLQVGDRLDARGTKPADNPNALVARSVVLMSARDLAQTHQAQAAEWQHATNGVVGSIDAAGGKVSVTTKTPEGPKTVVLNMAVHANGCSVVGVRSRSRRRSSMRKINVRASRHVSAPEGTRSAPTRLANFQTPSSLTILTKRSHHSTSPRTNPTTGT